MELTEERLFDALGVKRGEKDQEAAAPEETEAEGQEPEEEAEEPEETAEAPDDAGEEAEEAPEQTEEQRRENARRRREAEKQQAIDAAVKEALEKREQEFAERTDTFFQRAGLVNPYTKQPITNMDEFNAWATEQENKKLQKELSSGKLTKETLDSLIDKRQAEREAQEREVQAQQDREAQEQQQLQAEIDRQLGEIRKLDPSIKELKDLMNRPYSKDFYAAVQRGNNFIDAYYLATRSQQESITAEAARQSAINNVTGKKHLKATGIGGKAGATVTAEERKMFKLFNPDASDEAIQKYQNKYARG